MKENPGKKKPIPQKMKDRIGCRLNETQAKQWHEMLEASGKKEADLLKSILFKRTLTVQQVDHSVENLMIEVNQLVTELRSLNRKMSKERSDENDFADKNMTKLLEKALGETEKISEKIFQQWWQDTQ